MYTDVEIALGVKIDDTEFFNELPLQCRGKSGLPYNLEGIFFFFLVLIYNLDLRIFVLLIYAA